MHERLDILRPFEERDAINLAKLRSDFALQHLLLANPPSVQSENFTQEVKDWARRRSDQGYFCIVQAQDGSAAGFVQISNIHRKNRFGWLGLALLQETRGTGLGQATVQAIEKVASRQLNLRKLLLEVRTDNAIAICLYEKLGWQAAGRLRDHYDDGSELHDVLIYEKGMVPQ